jgi:hypothetical protein
MTQSSFAPRSRTGRPRAAVLSFAALVALAWLDSRPAAAQSEFDACPAELPVCTDDDTTCCYKPFAAGSLVIPMDRCHQTIATSGTLAPPTVNDAFCADPVASADAGMNHAYGLVYRAMQNDIPVYWSINPTKDPTAVKTTQTIRASQVYNDRDIDFWVLSSGATVPTVGGSLTACDTTAGCTPPVLRLDSSMAAVAGSYTRRQFPTRGASFIIDAADAPRFKELYRRIGEFSGFAGNPLYNFTTVDVYEVQAGAQIVYLDYRAAAGPYPRFNGGNSAPIAITLNYEPPRLARQTPANVSTQWLNAANLNEPANYPECLTAPFTPSTAVYCNVTANDVKSGYLTTGDFAWVWLDNSNGACDAGLLDEVREFVTAVPGVKDGKSAFLMEGPLESAEKCANKEPLGNPGGLAMVNQTVDSGNLILRYPTNPFSQTADIAPQFASGSPGSFSLAGNGYQDLSSLRRLVTEDVGTRCTDHVSTAACDDPTADVKDGAAYARLGDVEANGLVFYMAGNQITQSGNAAHLRMVLNSFLAIPAGTVDSTPESEVLVEVSRSAPVVATTADGEFQFQGTISVIDPPRDVTVFTGADSAADFRFPHFTGHLRAIDTGALTSTATDFDELPAFLDAASGIPTPNLAGCGGPPFAAGCRNVFTNVATGPLPTMVALSSTNAATLQPLMTPTMDEADTVALIGRVLAGGDGDLPALGGVDRSTLAVIESSPLSGTVRPAIAYFGALDGMLHAVCVEVLSPCTSVGQELWAYLPRTQLPMLARNQQRIDGSPKVVEVFGDPDGAGPISDSFRTVLVFQTGSGSPGFTDQAPAIIALDITDPASPIILWEAATPATRGSFELGHGLGLAIGPVKLSTGGTVHMTFAQTANGGIGGAGFVIRAFNTLTGDLIWSFDHGYPAVRTNGNLPLPVSGVPGGVAAYSSQKGSTLTHVVAPSLYGDLWLLDAETGANVHSTRPLFRFTTDYRPIGAPPTVFVAPQTGKVSALAISGGYADPVAVNWAPPDVEQFVVAMSLDVADYPGVPFTENTAQSFGLGFATDGTANRGFAQAVVAGEEVFIVTDSTDVNSAGYGLGNSNTGSLTRVALNGFSRIGSSTSIPGGAASVDVTAGGVSYAGAGKAAQKDDFSSDFTGGGTATELAYRDNVTRLLWISE